jgi:hypothetical protein
MFFSIGKPLVLGGFICSAPPAVAAYFISQRVVARHQRKKQQAQKVISPGSEENPS